MQFFYLAFHMQNFYSFFFLVDTLCFLIYMCISTWMQNWYITHVSSLFDMKLIIIISIIKTKEKLFNIIIPVLTLITRCSFLLLLYSMMTKMTRVTNAENRRTKMAVCVVSLGVSSCCTILASEIKKILRLF